MRPTLPAPDRPPERPVLAALGEPIAMPDRPDQPSERAPRQPPPVSQGLPRPGPTLAPQLAPTLAPKLGPTLGRIALVTAAALASLAANWLRWINPFVDSGREMNVPARLAAGEMLYRDVNFYYGPAGPWLQALVLRLADAGRRLTGVGRPRLRLSPDAALAAGRSWLPLEIACLALAAAILFLLYRLAAAAGGLGSALAATALAAAFCLGAPHGGAFIFPYSASSLYALAGGLLALVASLRPPGWQRRLLVAGGLALALAARAEIGAAVALILLVAALRSRPSTGGSRSAFAAVADLALGAGAAVAIYGAAFAGTSWHVLLTEGPLTHVLAMPPEWKNLYGTVSGLARLDRSLPQLAWGLALDVVLLLVCAWPAGAVRPRALPRVAFCAAIAAGIAAFSFWGGRLQWRWAGLAGELPPALFPLPLVAAAAALAALRRPLDDRGRARFLLFGLAAALACRVLLGCKIGPGMTAYGALPLPPLLATAGVLAGDLLAPRLRNPGGFRFRFLALAVGFAGLYLIRVGALAWGPHVVWLDTAAGSLRLPWKEANAVAGTLDYLAGRARPGDRLACFPEAGFFNFVSGLPNPLRQEQIFPGILDGGRETEAIARLLATRPRFVLLANRPTPEFGPRAFGEDYAAGLWSAVEDRYFIAATFGNAAEGAGIGARRFFIRVYEPDPAPAGQAAASTPTPTR
jgi:hypothetical protein